MIKVARWLPAMCAAVISGVFAAEPPLLPAAAAAPQSVAQTPAAAPTASNTADAQQPVSDKARRKVLVDDTVNDAQLRQILGKGYRPSGQARGNEVYYCRSQSELGSRFETKVCKTAAQILRQEQGGKEATTDLQRTGGIRDRQ